MGAGFLVPIKNDRPAIIQPVNLGRDGIAFMQSELLDREKNLSTAVARLFNGTGTAFAPLEKGESIVHAKQFKYGRSRPTVAIQKWLAGYIDSQWSGKGYQLIFEDPWMKPEDVKMLPQNLDCFFNGRAVYYTSGIKDAYEEMELANRQSNWLFFGFVISPIVPLPPSGKTVDYDYIKLLAKNTQAVFVIAYDHEGYVVWQR